MTDFPREIGATLPGTAETGEASADVRSLTDETTRAVAARLTKHYIVASTAALALTGVLGVLMRWSQAVPGARIGDNFWYAIMTAHGLGAFVGWAAFAVMGLAFWVLHAVGFPVRGFGYYMAKATWWLMVLGVIGVVITTVIMQFGASWVFLYPLSFYGAGEWGAVTAGLFSFSVLLVGLSIVTWCFAILHTVVNREALQAVKTGVGNRIGVALGWGSLWPRTFSTTRKHVPYPIIPLTVIAIDMIIATLPLAGLLIWQILQACGWVGETNSLVAKNILWWFGHPVVYLLLFPAVAAYYWLIPRYAGRPLVGGHIISIAWTVAVIANVLVWAHHVYQDYPEGSVQGQINIAMQPMTFSLVLPSALSLYSLGFTIYKSKFKWTPASTALFFGLVGWLLAGLSGIVNATAAFDFEIHNTLWIVGHFHHMAMLNMGFLIFGACYALLPELTGKALYSERMAWVHVWTTFIAGMIVFHLWEAQGLDGAPRRYAVLPSEYDSLTRWSLPFVFILAAAQALFFWNVAMTLLGKAGAAQFDEQGIPIGQKPKHHWSVPIAEGWAVLAALGVAVAFAVGGYFVGRGTSEGGGETVTVTTGSGGSGGGAATEADPENGKAVFASASCGTCHTFAPAGATGTVGPDLATTKLTEAQVRAVVASGRNAMPAFGDRLSEEDVADVSAFVKQPEE